MNYEYCTRDRDVPIYNTPRWNNHDFDTAQTVFLERGRVTKISWTGMDRIEGLTYVYEDRLWFMNEEQHKKACDIVRGSEIISSANYYEVFLSAFFEKPIKLEHILVGLNRADGFPYMLFGYKKGGE